jgi:hypothetical protein
MRLRSVVHRRCARTDAAPGTQRRSHHHLLFAIRVIANSARICIVSSKSDPILYAGQGAAAASAFNALSAADKTTLLTALRALQDARCARTTVPAPGERSGAGGRRIDSTGVRSSRTLRPC